MSSTRPVLNKKYLMLSIPEKVEILLGERANNPTDGNAILYILANEYNRVPKKRTKPCETQGLELIYACELLILTDYFESVARRIEGITDDAYFERAFGKTIRSKKGYYDALINAYSYLANPYNVSKVRECTNYFYNCPVLRGDTRKIFRETCYSVELNPERLADKAIMLELYNNRTNVSLSLLRQIVLYIERIHFYNSYHFFAPSDIASKLCEMHLKRTAAEMCYTLQSVRVIASADWEIFRYAGDMPRYPAGIISMKDYQNKYPHAFLSGGDLYAVVSDMRNYVYAFGEKVIPAMTEYCTNILTKKLEEAEC